MVQIDAQINLFLSFLVNDFSVVTLRLHNKSYIVKRPVYVSFKWSYICKEHASAG